MSQAVFTVLRGGGVEVIESAAHIVIRKKKTSLSLDAMLMKSVARECVELEIEKSKAVELALKAWLSSGSRSSVEPSPLDGERQKGNQSISSKANIAILEQASKIDLTNLTEDQIALVEAFAGMIRSGDRDIAPGALKLVSVWKRSNDEQIAEEVSAQSRIDQQKQPRRRRTP